MLLPIRNNLKLCFHSSMNKASLSTMNSNIMFQFKMNKTPLCLIFYSIAMPVWDCIEVNNTKVGSMRETGIYFVMFRSFFFTNYQKRLYDT